LIKIWQKKAAGMFSDLDQAAEWCLQQRAQSPPPYQAPQQAPAAPPPYQNTGAHLFGQQQQPPPPVYQPPSKPNLFTDADFGLFLADNKPKEPPPAYHPPPEQAPPSHSDQSLMGGNTTTPVVVATNPYGHAPMHVLSMPPNGVLDGAAAADEARKKAMNIRTMGKLWKLSGISSGRSSRLGNRWQARHFVLSQCTIAYGDLDSNKDGPTPPIEAALANTKKRFTLWGSFVVPEPPERAQGREFAFGVYRSDADAFAGAAGMTNKQQVIVNGDEREQLMLLAAEDAKQQSHWICSLLKATGRCGVLLRVGEDAAAYRLRCCYGDDALEMEAGPVENKVLIRKILSKSSGAGAVGLKVGDELVAVNGAHVPPLAAGAMRRMLEALPRPLDMELRRPRDPVVARELAAKAALTCGTDDDDEQLARRMRESMNVGAALRADKQARDERRLQEAKAKEIEAANLAKSIAATAKVPQAPRPQEQSAQEIQAAVTAVSTAVDFSARGDDYFYAETQDPAAAARAYKSALDSLLTKKDALADPNGAARRAVAQAHPGVSLADLFDHINANGAEASKKARASYGNSTHKSAIPTGILPEPESIQEDNQSQSSINNNNSAPPPPPRPQSSTAVPPYQIALYSYEPAEDWQLKLNAGDKLSLINKMDDGWSEVSLLDNPDMRGLVPSSYLADSTSATRI